MTININTSEFSKKLITEYSAKLKLPAENIIARIAFAFSISKNRTLDLKQIKDSKGKQYKDETFFGNYRSHYISLICQLYEIQSTDINIPKFIKMHIDDGLELMHKFFESNLNHTIYDFLIESIDRGIENIENLNSNFKFIENSNRQIQDKQFYDKIFKIDIGSTIEGNKIIFEPNNTSKYNNCHIAIAGTTGSGKTEFAKDLVFQFIEQAKDKANFIYLDFKGLNTEDQKKYKTFFEKTNTELINAPHKKIPINPLTFIDNINENNKKLGINKFVDYIVDYSKAGNSQKQQLRDSLRAVFNNAKKGKYPTLQDLKDEIPNHFQKIPNTVTEIIDGLSDPPIFSDETNKDFLNKNYYFSLSADLNQLFRFTSIFLIINYIYNTFMSMPDTPIQNGIRAIRYLLIIDEAQVIFRDKKSKFVLQQILEQIRSKGVIVILIAQNIDEFDQPLFDFSSLCEIGFLLKISDLSNLKKIQKFLGLNDKDLNVLLRSMEKLEPGQGVSNIKEISKGSLFNIKQFYNRK